MKEGVEAEPILAPAEEPDVPWQVTDLKQFAYCPRVVYYQMCLPRVRPTTYKMEASREAHVVVEAGEERRTLRAYGLDSGQRHFNVALVSERLGMRGQVDMVIESTRQGKREVIPVDYKLSTETAENVRLQLTAYAVMLEEAWGEPVRRGFLYLIPLRRAEEVRFTARLRTLLGDTLAEMNQMLLGERMPDPVAQRAKCVDCEFRRFCNDVG